MWIKKAYTTSTGIKSHPEYTFYIIVIRYQKYLSYPWIPCENRYDTKQVVSGEDIHHITSHHITSSSIRSYSRYKSLFLSLLLIPFIFCQVIFSLLWPFFYSIFLSFIFSLIVGLPVYKSLKSKVSKYLTNWSLNFMGEEIRHEAKVAVVARKDTDDIIWQQVSVRG